MSESIRYTAYSSPVGRLTLACGGAHLVGAWFDGQKYHGGTLYEMTEGGAPVLEEAKRWLDSYFGGERPSPAALPLRPAGSAFRQAVWRILCGIPYGEVVTYGDVAEQIAAALGRAGMSAQAVGGAVGHNPLSVIIPCHRVVGADGSLTGYAGGVDRKKRLLEREGADMSRLFVPARGTAL